MAVYSAQVEQWRQLVSKYFQPEDVDKALYVINGESGGNPSIAGDGGNSIGLFQMNMGGGLGTGSNAKQLSDPEYNIKLAAQAVYGGSGWKPWGEGSTYQGKPFGALGNNPYGGPVNGRANVGASVKPLGTKPTVLGQTAPKPASGSIAKAISRTGAVLGAKKIGSQATNATHTVRGMTSKPYVPTGDYASDIGYYSDAADDAYRELQKYQSSFDGILQFDEEGGVVYKYDPNVLDKDGNVAGGLIPDPVGTKLLAKAQFNEQAVDRLLAKKKAGLVDTGEGAAAAYLANEKEKRASASVDYEDYKRRISDLVAIEDIPIARAANAAALIKATNNSEHTSRTGWGTAGQAQRTDLGPIAASMRSALPAEAPKPYSVGAAAAALNTPAPPQMPPPREPDDILAEYHGGAAGGRGVIEGLDAGLPTTQTGLSNIPEQVGAGGPIPQYVPPIKPKAKFYVRGVPIY